MKILDSVVRQGPFVAPRRFRRLSPYLALAILAVASVVLQESVDAKLLVIFGCGAGTVTALAILLPWQRLPRRGQGILVLVPIILVGVGMRADSELNSIVLSAILIPLIWLALDESKECLIADLILAGCVILLEILRRPDLGSVLRGLVVISIAVAPLPSLRHLVHVNHAALIRFSELAERDAVTDLVNRRGWRGGRTSACLAT